MLLFQDIAVIPTLALMPFLASPELLRGVQGGEVHASGVSLVAGRAGWQVALVTLLVTLTAVAVLILFGRWVVTAVLRYVAQTRMRKLYTAAALMILLGVALLMPMAGLSPTFGTFLAGVLLSGSEYRHELEADLNPFRGLLLGVFFMTVGAGINVALLAPLRNSADVRGSPFPGRTYSRGFRDGYAERGVVVQDGDADLEFGNLTVEVPCHEALAQKFHTMQLRLDATPAEVPSPSSPKRPTKVFGGTQGVVSRRAFVRHRSEELPADAPSVRAPLATACAPAVVVFQGFAFLRGGMTAWAPRSAIAPWYLRGDGRSGIDPVDQFSPERAKPRVAGTAGGRRTDPFAKRYLAEQIGQDRCVTDTPPGDLPSRQICFANRLPGKGQRGSPACPHQFRDGSCARPAAWERRACGRATRLRLNLDAGAVRCPAGHCGAISGEGISGCSGPLDPRYGVFAARVFWRRDSVLKSGTVQSRPTSRNKLSTKPAVWRKAMPNSLGLRPLGAENSPQDRFPGTVHPSSKGRSE